jgi:acetolactate synthase regulatory subunit
VIASQIEKECMARDETLERYLAAVRRREVFFKGFTVKHIERAKNTKVDELAKVAAKKRCYHQMYSFRLSKTPS